MDAAEARFAEETQKLIKTCQEKYDYTPTRYIQMVQTHGAVNAARSLLDKTEPSEGFIKLLELGRLDLTVEALTLRPEFQLMFAPEQLRRARERLGRG